MLTTLTLVVLHLVEPELLPNGGLAPPEVDRTGPTEVKAFAEYVDRHLLLLETRGFTIRQRERVYHLGDDDIGQAFALVPEAQALALKAQKNFRIASTITGIATGAALSLVLLPVLATIPPAAVATLILSGLGVATMLLAVPFQLIAQAQFTSAINVYNRALLDPSRREQVDALPEAAPDVAGHGSGAVVPRDAEVHVSAAAAASP